MDQDNGNFTRHYRNTLFTNAAEPNSIAFAEFSDGSSILFTLAGQAYLRCRTKQRA